jgi:DNA-directed RNA polymerase specialized sigma24 family protein
MGATLWRIASEDELVACYDATVTDLFRYACRLVGDRAAAEDLVSDAYLALLRAAQDGSVDAVTIGWLITVVRRRHLDRLRSTAREERRLRLVQAPGRGAAPVDPGDQREGCGVVRSGADGHHASVRGRPSRRRRR